MAKKNQSVKVEKAVKAVAAPVSMQALVRTIERVTELEKSLRDDDESPVILKVLEIACEKLTAISVKATEKANKAAEKAKAKLTKKAESIKKLIAEAKAAGVDVNELLN